MAIPYLTFKDPAAAMAIYKEAFGAETIFTMDGPEGFVMHAEMNIAGSRLMLSGEWSGMSSAPSGRSPVNFMIYVDNVDAALKTAVAAGMNKLQDPEDMFWGDRIAKVADGHGYEWTLAHQYEEVSPEEMNTRAMQWMASMSES